MMTYQSLGGKGRDTIGAIVDRFRKAAYFVLLAELMSADTLANLLFNMCVASWDTREYCLTGVRSLYPDFGRLSVPTWVLP